MSNNKNTKVNGFKRAMVKLLGNEKTQGIAIPIFSILVSLLAVSLMVILFGKNPIDVFKSIMQGSGVLPKAAYASKKGMLTDFMAMLGILTPMIFASLAVAIAFKTGLFNIGVSGQMLISAFIATITVGYSELPSIIAKPLVIVIGIFVGALAGAVIGYLKYKFNINEVVTSIMLNYIFANLISFFINSYYVNPVSRQSRYVSAASRLTVADFEAFGLKMDLPLAFILTIPAAFLVKYIFEKTKLGYELKAVGLNRNASKYAGMNVGKNIILAMIISGAFAGVAGVTYYMGYFSSIQPKVLSSLGFDAIAVSLLGNSDPIGIIFSSLLITVISRGSNYMSSSVGLQQEIAQVITGLILLFTACGVYIKYKVNGFKEEIADEERALKKEGGKE